MKSLITESDIVMTEKFREPVTVSFFGNFVVTTNEA